MTDEASRAEELCDRANDLPIGPTKIALLEEAVQLADSIQDVDLAYALRNDLMYAASFFGRPDIMLVAFAWCLGQYDRDPERFDRHEILWKYKWVMGHSFKFPQISRARLEALLADMERRFRENGSSLYAVELDRRHLFLQLGERKLSQAAHAKFRKCRRDDLSDCLACVASKDCDYHCFQRQWKRSLEAAAPVLMGHLDCAEQPHIILANVLLPLFHLRRHEEAKAYQHRGYRLVSRGQQFVEAHAAHLRFLVLVGDVAQAKRVLERHLPGALESVEINERFDFLLASRLWSDRLAGLGTLKLKVRLPAELPAAGADGKTDVRACGEWFAAKAKEIALQFDARNGTDLFQQQIDELPALLRLAVD